MVSVEIKNEYNPIENTPKILYLYLEGTIPICNICNNEIKSEYCYFMEETKEFNCLNCIVDGKVGNFKTGFVIPKILDKSFGKRCSTVRLIK